MDTEALDAYLKNRGISIKLRNALRQDEYDGMGLLALLDSKCKEKFLEKHPSLPQGVCMSLTRLLTGLFAFIC